MKTIGMKRVLTFVGFLSVFGGNSRGQEQPSPPEKVIARAGDAFISEKEFLERYELLPGFGRQVRSQAQARKMEVLYSIIAEKLLAQDAAARGLDRDSVLALAVRETRKLLARDAMYKREVIAKSPVSPKELSTGIAEALIELSVRYIYFEKAEDAAFVRAQMHRFEDFRGLRIDSSFHALRDTATLVWGEADPAVESAAYHLKKNEISPVVRAGTGYYIITVAAVRRNFAYASLASDVLRDRVLTILRRRKEKARLEEFAPGVLRGKTGYASPVPLNRLVAAFERVFREGSRDSIVYLTPERASAIDSICAASPGDTLAVAGSRVWSTADVITLLTDQGFGVHRTALGSIPLRLNTELEGLVQRELIGEEALRRGLDTTADVRREVEIWRESFLAALDREQIAGETGVTDADVWATMKWRDSSVTVPQVQLRELQTSTFTQMQSAMDELAHGVPMEDVVKRWSIDPAARGTGGLTPYFPVTDRSPLGAISSRLRTGERYGPLNLPGGPVYFEVTGKKEAPLDRDTSLARRFAEARKETLGMKQRRALTLRLAALAKEKGVDVYEDRLKALTVSPIPMMTFRILGFGGRMLAVPFVTPELDWLGVDVPKGNTVP
jgi:parvulin-like peptidyl-prolyl isomerase